MSKVYCIRSKEYIQKALSENKVTSDMIDFSAVQTFADYSAFTNPEILYNVADFLFELSEKNEKVFADQNYIELSKADKFGWYYGKIHKSEIQIFSATSSQKYQKITDQNENLVITSFDKYRGFYRASKATNLLTGAFGLSYLSFRDEYASLFREIKIEKDQWIINWSGLELPQKMILTQLFLYHNAETNMLNDKVFIGSDIPLKMFSTVLEKAMNYFLLNDYTMDNFLTKMSASIQKEEGLKLAADELIELNEKYIKRGVPYDPKNPFAKIIKEFIDLGKTETDKLGNFIDADKLNPTAVFLVGMLQLGDRIDELLSFDQFIFSFVDLTMRHIVDIKATESEVFITFDKKIVDRDRNNQFKYVSEYFQELRSLKKVKDEINDLTEKNELFKKAYHQIEDIVELTSDIDDLKVKIEEFSEQKKSLKEKADKAEKERKGAEDFLGQIKSEQEQIQNDIDEIEQKNKTLEQERNARKLQLENLKKEPDSEKSKESKKEVKKKDDNPPEAAEKPSKNSAKVNTKLPQKEEMEELNKKKSDPVLFPKDKKK